MLRAEQLMKSFTGGSGRKSRKSENHEEQVFAVNGVSFEVAEGELVTLLGPSGCGKTTTLRAVAGLERPDSGTIRLGDRTVFSQADRINVPSSDRQLGMVFQSYAIWPHMDVYHNVSFPLEVTRRRHKMSSRDIRAKVETILEAVELAPMRDRPATNLSGGQQQRLALARALVTEPELVLLDEPLSNLDAKLRESLRLELKRMQRELGLTMLYVTHDQQEALALSTVVAVMNKGKIVQVGTPREIYNRPSSRFVAEFIGTSNFLRGVISAVNGELSRVKTAEGELWTTVNPGLAVGTEVTVSVRPEEFAIGTAPQDGAGANNWSGTVVTRAFLGDVVDHVVRLGEAEVRCRSNPSISIAPETPVYLSVQPHNVQLLPDES